MMTPAQLFLETLKPEGHPDRLLKQYEALDILFENPLDGYLMGQRIKGGPPTKDRWGTLIAFPANAPGAMPVITDQNKVCPDITRWREFCHTPDLVGMCSSGWESVRTAAEEAHRKGKLSAILMGCGIFEQCHFLMGFQDTLTNLYEHPQQMHELIDYITEYRLTYAKILAEQLHPDVIISHDDWGSKDALFMKPEMWREFFKEPYRRFYGYLKSQGIISVHHADSYLVPIIEDMVEIGIPCWQGVLPENDIPALQRKLHGRMVLMGGVGAEIDRADAGAEEIETYVTRVLEENAPGGAFIPCITYGAPGTIYPHVHHVINLAIDRWNSTAHLADCARPVPVHRIVSSCADSHAAKQQNDGEMELLPQIAAAVRRGQKAKVLKLCAVAIDTGIDAQQILTKGLTEGMTQLGEDFSAGRAFVPEMLMAARCMTAATDILKPHLTASASGVHGRVCLGTVKGDMHDIGKSLVKIMLEGSGLEVIDLGCDVPAEDFVRTAQEKHCDIIACSALLTTTMEEMRRVISLCRDAGIRDEVKIMIGGAPTSQKFCDEIGADIYTVDAAAAARVAANILTKK